MFQRLFKRKEKNVDPSWYSLFSPEDTLIYFTDLVGMTLQNKIFFNKSLDDLQIQISPYMYLQLRNYWGVDFSEIIDDDPIYSRIAINPELTIEAPLNIVIIRQ